MKYLYALSLFPLISLADPAIQHVQVNIHNNTEHVVEFKSFDTSRLLASVRFTEEKLPPFFSAENAIFVTAFDKDPITSGVNIEYEGQQMKLMWQANLGFGDPDDPKTHMCGVIQEGRPGDKHVYCHIPYVESGVLYVDFQFN